MNISPEAMRILERHNLHLEIRDNVLHVREDDTGIFPRVFQTLHTIIENTPPVRYRRPQIVRIADIFTRVMFKIISESARVTYKQTKKHPAIAGYITMSILAVFLYFRMNETKNEIIDTIKATGQRIEVHFKTAKAAVDYESRALVIHDLEQCINLNFQSLAQEFMHQVTPELMTNVRDTIRLPSIPSEVRTHTANTLVSTDVRRDKDNQRALISSKKEDSLRDFAKDMCLIQRGGNIPGRFPLDLPDTTGLDVHTFNKVLQTRQTTETYVNYIRSTEAVLYATGMSIAAVGIAWGIYKYKSIVNKQREERAMIEPETRTDEQIVRDVQGEPREVPLTRARRERLEAQFRYLEELQQRQHELRPR